MQYRFKHKEPWVLVELYIAPAGFVAHWFSHSGKHSYESVDARFNRGSDKVAAMTTTSPVEGEGGR